MLVSAGAMGTPPPPAAGAPPKQHKSRRKISLPWFRQSSVSAPHAALSRQHTIDTPGSFHARLLKATARHRQAGPEMTWVVGEHVSAGAGELTVTKGQQVEVVEAWSARADWWIVRIPGDVPQEGAVPAHILKPQPHQGGQKTSPSRRPLSQPCEETIEASASDSGAVSAASPGKQRRGRRWLPNLRRPSQGKGEKAPSGAQSPAAGADKPPPLKKEPSDKKIKIPYAGDNGRAGDDVFENSHGAAQAALDEAEDDAAELELPPPMKPIHDPQSVLQQTPTPSTTATVAPTREQHGGTASGTTRSDTAEDEEPATPGAEGVEAALRKREYVLQELLDTEKIYVSDLKLVCEGYLRHLQDPNAEPPLPEGLKDRRHRMIFGNIEAIYEWHRDIFLRDLQACLTAPELLGPLFRKFLEKRLFMYEAYCRNKPVSEYIVSEHEQYFQELRQKFGHKLQLSDLLIKPIQRIQKYHLLVPKILAYSISANAGPNVIAALREAEHCTSIIPKNANDMMDVGRLQGFTGNITSQGKLLLQEPLICADISNGGSGEKGKELHVFLFEQCMIFSEAIGKKTQFTSPTYNYKAHIQVNKMELEETEGSSAFVIHSVDPNKPRTSYLCRAPEARRQQWISTLSRILQSQRIFGEALENPGAYLRELTREPTRDPAADGWCALRKTESVPPPLTSRLAPELRGRQQRPHAKANTINLPPNAGRTEDRKNPLSPTSPPSSNGLSKRPWGLKLRRGAGSGGEPGEGSVTELRPPELTAPLADVTVTPGVAANLSCRVIAQRATTSWRKTGPEIRALRHGGRFVISYTADGSASLTINACRPSDAGVYCCLISNDVGGVQSSARLTVNAGSVPGVPAVRAHSAGGFVVQWEEPTAVHLEYCRVGEGEWQRATDASAATDTIVLEELPVGQYTFRVVCAQSGVAGAPTAPAAAGGPDGWQREQFARRYAVEEEIGRGRTARVLLGRDTGTGQRVALKQVVSGRGADASREFRALSRAAHPGLVCALALFPEVPRPGFHTLVLELVNGPTLLEWASQEQLTEAVVATHMKQLLAALDALHAASVAHLDVRPENILVDLNGPQPQLKLIDLGSALEVGSSGSPVSGEVLPPAPTQLEFAPPEYVLGRPASPAWDAWASGVFLYVFLTGLSPFLDESVEETTANIIKCDYCFPPEHWEAVDERPRRLIRALLDASPARRLTPRQAMADTWFQEAPATALPGAQLKTFLERRRPHGHAGTGALAHLRSPDT